MSKKKEKTAATFEYQYSPEYREYYATGARGGIQSGYHVHFEFYIEKQRLPKKQKLVVDQDDNKRIENVGKSEIPVIERDFLVGLDMSFHAVRELHRWLSGLLGPIDEIIEQMGEVKEKEEGSTIND